MWSQCWSAISPFSSSGDHSEVLRWGCAQAHHPSNLELDVEFFLRPAPAELLRVRRSRGVRRSVTYSMSSLKRVHRFAASRSRFEKIRDSMSSALIAGLILRRLGSFEGEIAQVWFFTRSRSPEDFSAVFAFV